MGQQPPDRTGSDVERARRRANAGTRTAWVLPVVHPGESPTSGLDRALARAVVAAAAGDTDARNALYFALAWPIAGYVARHRRRAFASGGTWDLDDVGQEACLALVETIEEWSGEPPFLAYFA